MFSALQTGADLPIAKLTNAAAGTTTVTKADGTTETYIYAQHKLESGIYYIDEADVDENKNLTINGGDNKTRNGIAVAENATAYIYIPANFTLTVYGGNGNNAANAGPGTANTATFIPCAVNGVNYTMWPGNAEPWAPGAAGTTKDTGGGAAIYVPSTAKLVVLGGGTIHAFGGNGGNASQGAAGTSTNYWLFNYGSSEGKNGVNYTHRYTNKSAWNKFIMLNGNGAIQCMIFQTGAGGTGGSGAGGGGAAIGANGADGAEGAQGGETEWVAGNAVSLDDGDAATSEVTPPAAGLIAIANTVAEVTGEGGKGGDACTTTVTETWNNQPVYDTDGIPTIKNTEVKFTLPITAHARYAASSWTASPSCVKMNVFFTNARKGGNGGAGGKGSSIGAGGAGGAGGGGGDSGSVVVPIVSPYTTYWKENPVCGANGADATAVAPESKQTFNTTTDKEEKMPYSTITFNGASTAPEKYYLQNERTITVPGYTTAGSNFVFHGWKVATPATALPEVFGETVNENAEKLLTKDAVYQAGDKITTTGFYGNVELTPVVEETLYTVDAVRCTVSVGTQTDTNHAVAVHAGETVNINADIAAPGSEINGITVYKLNDAGEVDDTAETVTLKTKDFENGTASFLMPTCNVRVVVSYSADNYEVRVTNGTVVGAIEQKGGRKTAVEGHELTLTADQKVGKKFKDWTLEPSDVAVTGDPTKDATIKVKMPKGDLTATANYEDIVYTVSVEPDPDDNNNGHCTVTPAAGGIMGATITLQAKDRTADGWEFESFTVTADDLNNEKQGVVSTGDRTGTFTMPASNVTVKVNYRRSGYAVTVRNGKLKVGADGGWVNVAKAQAGTEITLQARTTDTAAGEVFTGWKFTQDKADGAEVTVNVPDGSNPATSQTLTIEMPAKNIVATATYRGTNGYTIHIKDEDGQDSGYAQMNGMTITSARPGDDVTVIAAAKLDEVFDHWDVSCADTTLELDDYFADFDSESESAHFTMPGCEVTFTAHYKHAVSGDPTQGGAMMTTGEAAGVAVAAVGVTVAVWQGSELAMRIYRDRVIQVSYWPGSRIQLAQLLWSRAGMPEPESDAPFADITEAQDTLNDTSINAQKAARWCVEQGLLDAKGSDDGTECFEPAKAVSRLRVCLTWENARSKGLLEVPAQTE